MNTDTDEVHLGALWSRRRLAILLHAYDAAAYGAPRHFAGWQLREFVRVNPDLIDLIPGEVWVEIYRVRAQGTVAP
jgi:hypothetical protein